MLNVSISVTGLTEAQQALQSIQAIFTDFSKETQEIGDYAINFFKGEVYDSQGGAYGAPWAPLSEPYATYKSKKYGDQLILVASGKMRESYVMETSANSVTIKNEAQNDKGEYYAYGHQTGSGYLPQRLLMELDAQRMADISLIVTQSISERIFGALL